MDLLLALLLQSAIAPDGAPRLSYAQTEQPAPRPRINQGRSIRLNLDALDRSLSVQAGEEHRSAPPAQARPGRAVPGRVSLWNGVPVRMINGQPHGVW